MDRKGGIMAKLVEGLTAHNGYQVPYALLWVKGKPDFTAADLHKVEKCADKKLCGICGQALGKSMAFIGGIRATVFIDPPNHPRCADTAMASCPFLKGKRTRDSEDSAEKRIFLASGYRYDRARHCFIPRYGLISQTKDAVATHS